MIDKKDSNDCKIVLGFDTCDGNIYKDSERAIILKMLNANKGNKTHTAKSLGIGLRTLQRKLARYTSENNEG